MVVLTYRKRLPKVPRPPLNQRTRLRISLERALREMERWHEVGNKAKSSVSFEEKMRIGRKIHTILQTIGKEMVEELERPSKRQARE